MLDASDSFSLIVSAPFESERANELLLPTAPILSIADRTDFEPSKDPVVEERPRLELRRVGREGVGVASKEEGGALVFRKSTRSRFERETGAASLAESFLRGGPPEAES